MHVQSVTLRALVLLRNVSNLKCCHVKPIAAGLRWKSIYGRYLGGQ
jgi:hypothetical protein